MFTKMLKKTLLLTGTCVMLLASTAAAIPPAIEIPETLREGKLLRSHRQQINDRVAWWKQRLLAAITDEEIHTAGQKLLGDYLLYPNPSYQKEFAEETLKQYTNILNGKAFEAQPDNPNPQSDPLAMLKRINAALVLTQMDQPILQPGMEILVNDKNEALRYIGWLGYTAIRKNLLNTSEAEIKTMLEAAKKANATETSPILLSQMFRVMNLGTVEGKIDEKLRLVADKAFLLAIRSSWANRCKQVLEIPLDNDSFLPAMRLAVMALRSIGEDLNRATPKDEKAVTACLQMAFDMASAAAQTYDRAWQNRKISAVLVEQCTDLLVACEGAFTALSGTKNTFLAEKTNMQVEVPARGAAVLEAVLVHWGEALKPKGITETPATK